MRKSRGPDPKGNGGMLPVGFLSGRCSLSRPELVNIGDRVCAWGCPGHSASSGPSSLQAEACWHRIVWSFGQYLLSTCYLPVLAGAPVV